MVSTPNSSATGKKVQVPVLGGLRKVIRVGQPASTGTTISGFENQVVTLAQLRAQLGLPAGNSASVQPGGGSGGAASATITVGPGLAGGGPVIGNVPLYLTAPIPAFIFDDGGGEGDPGPPGAASRIAGPTGAGGPPGASNGPAVYAVSDELEADWFPIQGNPGQTGGAGQQGGNGPAVYLAGDDAESEWFPVPGPAGAAGSGGSGSSLPVVPAAVPNLVYWFATDKLTEASGSTVGILPSANPQRCPTFAAQLLMPTGSVAIGPTIDTALVNGLPVLAFPGTANGDFNISVLGASFADAMTFFAVLNPLATVAGDIMSGQQHAMDIQITTGAKLTITESNVAVEATSSSGMTANAYQQICIQWLNSTKAYLFRIGRAAAGSGTGSAAFTSTTIVSSALFYNGQVNSNFFGGKFAEMLVYNRVLTGPEITAVEAYLLAKWGV